MVWKRCFLGGCGSNWRLKTRARLQTMNYGRHAIGLGHTRGATFECWICFYCLSICCAFWMIKTRLIFSSTETIQAARYKGQDLRGFSPLFSLSPRMSIPMVLTCMQAVPSTSWRPLVHEIIYLVFISGIPSLEKYMGASRRPIGFL